MSNVCLTDKIVKTRKDHRCAWCGEEIPKGASIRFTSGIFEDNFYSNYMHDECDAAALRSDTSYEGFMPFDNQRGIAWQEE